MAGQHRLGRRGRRRRPGRRAAHRRERRLNQRIAVFTAALAISVAGCSGDDGGNGQAQSSTAAPSSSTTVADSPIPTATGSGVAIGGRASEVFVDLDGYEYVDPPAAVLDRFTAGFATQAEAAAIVDSVAAKTVVPRDRGPGDGEGAVVVSVAIDESVGPLADGFREGVLSSLSAQASPEEIALAGRPATYVDTGEQQAIYVQDGTLVLFFVGADGREPLLAVAEALVSRLSP